VAHPPLPIRISVLSKGHPDLERVQDIERASLPGPHRTGVADQLEQAFTHAWVATADDGTPAGFLVTWLVADEVHVLDVASSPTARRMGVGRALMHQALEFARQNQARLIVLEVRRQNIPAVSLYRRLGFAIMRLRKGYYDDGEDALEMMLVLDPETGEIVPGQDEVELEDA